MRGYIFLPKSRNRATEFKNPVFFLVKATKMTLENATSEAHTLPLLTFVSANLTTISVPDRPCWGQWLLMPHISPHWHRRLDDPAYLYLRHAVAAAIQAKKLDPDSAEAAETRLAQIHRIGRGTGQLTPSTDNPFAEPLAGWQWATGLPDLCEYNFK